jgi:lycopene beta-cyclase
MESYDYILAGSGCAGLSLVYYLLESELKDSKILLIDPAGKTIPDKTWCYWAENPLDIHPKDSIHFWNKLSFATNKTKITNSLGSLNYYHLNSRDFYRSVFRKLDQYPNVKIIRDEVLEIIESGDFTRVKTQENGDYLAGIVFDSRLREDDFETNTSLKQIFSGWRIKTQTDAFDPTSLTLMDFSGGNTSQFEFFYILPFSETEALVEYTAYSQDPISESKLKSELSKYLRNLLRDEPYDITFRESGMIPMSTKTNASPNTKRIIKIGTAAGWTKASTGYTFHSIQKNCKQIVENLVSGNAGNHRFKSPSRFSFYDNILLNIAHKWPEKLPGLFLNLFNTSHTDLVLRFLNEETTLGEELQILGKLRFPIFIKSLLNYESH